MIGVVGRIPDPAIAELEINGELLCYVQQRKPEQCSDVELAALAAHFRSLATTHEERLDRPADEVLDAADVDLQVHDDDPENVDE